ncbi:PREDICTED: diacylglycerol kinase theta-like [Tarenaya hassleriana]|uniref:diacylglycerol kinase theta-like n=1 Tax=Tarenaya hassleriana TaxID=28532 RepID=UPI00053C51CF|nr:PREDICTED: diacylglycerol kinase theta-like [Tarenaya hassleriana]
MGRPKAQPGSSIRHFSHPHPLQFSASDPRDGSASCSACKLKLAGLPSYSCLACAFNLHEKCAEMPRKIKHPFDEIHLLTLIPLPRYEEGRFRCDACGKDGDGFSYHCGDCGIDLHTVCANMPSHVSNQSHPQHELRLTFSVPDSSGSFCCMICRGMGSNSWLYRCNECGFNAHLICARKRVRQQSSNPAPNVNNCINRPNPSPHANMKPNHLGPANAAASRTVNQILSNVLASSSSDPDPDPDQDAHVHEEQ